MERAPIIPRLIAEFLGTFTLVFAGTGAIVVNEASGGTIGHGGIALVFGLVVMAMIHTFGDVSGAHLNPAVTLGFATAGRFPWNSVAGYVSSQVAGAISASLSLRFLFPDQPLLGSTHPSGSVPQSFVFEIVLTTILMFVILSVTTGGKEKRAAAAVTIGAVVALGALFAGPVSGASMNPARSLAPAIVSGNFQHLWLYTLATISGACLAVPLLRAVRG